MRCSQLPLYLNSRLFGTDITNLDTQLFTNNQYCISSRYPIQGLLGAYTYPGSNSVENKQSTITNTSGLLNCTLSSGAPDGGNYVTSSSTLRSVVDIGVIQYNKPATIICCGKNRIYIQNGYNSLAYTTFNLNIMNTSSAFGMNRYNSIASGASTIICSINLPNYTPNTWTFYAVVINYPNVLVAVNDSTYTGTMSMNCGTSAFPTGLQDISAHNSIQNGSISTILAYQRALDYNTLMLIKERFYNL